MKSLSETVCIPGDPSMPERFWQKVDVSPSGCWLWTGYTFRGGYAGIQWNGKTSLAHRVAYESLIGKIPDGLHTDHLCRIRHCVNPSHLEPVTCAENLLRGDTLNARNANKTHCLNGHPFSHGNTYVTRDGKRQCRECGRRRVREYKARKARKPEDNQ
jgi:hypothetical protein